MTIRRAERQITGKERTTLKTFEGMEGMLFRFALLPTFAMFITVEHMIQRLSNEAMHCMMP